MPLSFILAGRDAQNDTVLCQISADNESEAKKSFNAQHPSHQIAGVLDTQAATSNPLSYYGQTPTLDNTYAVLGQLGEQPAVLQSVSTSSYEGAIERFGLYLHEQPGARGKMTISEIIPLSTLLANAH